MEAASFPGSGGRISPSAIDRQHPVAGPAGALRASPIAPGDLVGAVGAGHARDHTIRVGRRRALGRAPTNNKADPSGAGLGVHCSDSAHTRSFEIVQLGLICAISARTGCQSDNIYSADSCRSSERSNGTP